MHILCAYAAAIEAGPLPQEGLEAEFLELGVGKTAATRSITLRLAQECPDLVILFGIGGAYPGSPLQVGDLCLLTQDALADEGVATDQGFSDLDELALGTVGPFQMDPTHTSAIATMLGLEVETRGATVSSCSGSEQRARELATRSGAQVESMEGAAVAYACADAGVPMVQLRCISNFAGDRAQGCWDLEGSTATLQETVRQVVRGLTP